MQLSTIFFFRIQGVNKFSLNFVHRKLQPYLNGGWDELEDEFRSNR